MDLWLGIFLSVSALESHAPFALAVGERWGRYVFSALALLFMPLAWLPLAPVAFDLLVLFDSFGLSLSPLLGSFDKPME